MQPPYKRRVQIIKQALGTKEFVKQIFKYLLHDIKVIFIAVFTLLYSIFLLCVSILSVILLPIMIFAYPYIGAVLYRSNVQTRPNPFVSSNSESDKNEY